MFINELFDKDFYEPTPKAEKNQHTIGNIYWTHTYYPHENLELWRPCSDGFNEPTRTIATKFQIEPAKQDRFDSLTLGVPKLKSNEEFIVIRAKMRPVIMLLPQIEIKDVNQLNKGAKIWRPRCLVAQVFSVADKESNDLKFPEQFLDNVKRLKYPQLLFLPKSAGLFEVDGMARLDECQSVFTSHLQPADFRLSPTIKKLLQSQFSFLLNREDECYYKEIKEFLESD
jgi:hypothetical protein